mmetsp:Transcript_42116/g.127775  ORF Transcript_42116/g.127775 Transcript_42116/m.127775 type:complete len:132 (-) Transcript_42116:618-1013(-)
MRRHPSAFPAAAAVASSAAVILLSSPSVLAEVVTIAAEPEETAAVVQEWTVPEVQVQVHPEPVVVQMEPIAITIPTATNPEVVVYDGPDYFADEPEPEPEPCDACPGCVAERDGAEAGGGALPPPGATDRW